MKTAVIYDKWLAGLGGGEVVACTVAQTLRDNGYSVTFLSQDSVPVEKIKEKLGIDLSDISFKQVTSESDLQLLTTNHQPLTTIDLFINISFMDYSYGIGKKNIYYVHFPSEIRSGLFNYVLLFFKETNLQSFFPNRLREKIEDRLRAGIYPDMKKRLNSYDTFICHSEFVKKWIKTLWNKDAIVLYPPVKLITDHQPPTTKLNWICSVGRFFTLGHGKKQEVLIEAFKKLYSELTTNHRTQAVDLQLHLVGGVGNEPSSLRYVEQLKEMAKGYPIFFHLNVKRQEVEDILLKSKIYWHAGGFGETNPINMEHFGIAPVEALSAGCIPLLYNGGGLIEIIEAMELEKKNHLFFSIDELINITMKTLLNKQVKIQQNLARYSGDLFKKNLIRLLEQ